MNKSSFLHPDKSQTTQIALICLLGMIAGFLVSRVALSISVFLFGMNAIRGISPRDWLRQKWWLAGVSWVALYALTWFWTTDTGNWHTRLEVKLPFLLLPLAFAYLPQFSQKQLQIYTLGLGIMLALMACYSVSFLVMDPKYYYKEYHQSHLLPTLPKNDYIRASIAIALYIVWSVYMWPALSGARKWVTGLLVLFLVIYLHVLAAKSGLLSLYIFIVGYGFYLFFTRRRLAGLVTLFTIPLFFTLAVTFMPTFRQRKDYMDFTYFKLVHGDRTGEYGDIDRLMSYNIAAKLIANHPFTGVGTGDMLTEMKKGYDQRFPEVTDEHRLLPHNQFLIVALGCGLPAMVLFIVWVFMPLARIRRNRQSFFFFMVWLILFLQLMIEPVLEVQFGVFVYLFFLLMQWHELRGAGIKQYGDGDTPTK